MYHKILVVEDEQTILDSLSFSLSREGYTVVTAMDGVQALNVFGGENPDVVLLDLGLPDADGVDVCRRLRARSNAGIIIVTARGEEPERVLALDAGADDYLVKPFGLAELLARIRAVLRRVRPGGDVLRHGPLAVDLRTRKVTVHGREVALTPKEFDILECLAADPGRMMTRQEITTLYDMITIEPAKALNLPGFGLAVGAPANFVVLGQPDEVEALRHHAQPAHVISHGRRLDAAKMQAIVAAGAGTP